MFEQTGTPKKKRRWTPWAILGTIVASLLGGALWLRAFISDPNAFKPWLASIPSVTVDWEDAEWLGESWGIRFEGLRIEPHDKDLLQTLLDEIIIESIDTQQLWDGVLALGHIHVTGMHLELPSQAPPAPWEPQELFLTTITAAGATIRESSFHAPEWGPNPEITIEGLAGDVGPLTFVTYDRDLRADARAKADALMVSIVTLTDIRAPIANFTSKGMDINGFAFLGDHPLQARLRIGELFVLPSVHGEFKTNSLPIGQTLTQIVPMVAPPRGLVNIQAKLQAAGSLKPGDVWTSVNAQTRDVRLFLPSATPPELLSAMRLFPSLRVHDNGELDLDPVRASVRIRMPNIDFVNVRYLQDRATPLQLQGWMSANNSEMVVRFEPQPKQIVPNTLAFHLSGAPSDLKVRLAKRKERMNPPKPRISSKPPLGPFPPLPPWPGDTVQTKLPSKRSGITAFDSKEDFEMPSTTPPMAPSEPSDP